MCDANSINGCTTPGWFILDDRGQVHFNNCGPNFADSSYGPREYFCSETCANEMCLEDSEGTYQPFPNAPNALTPEQIQENKSYGDPDDRYGSRPGENGYCDW